MSAPTKIDLTAYIKCLGYTGDAFSKLAARIGVGDNEFELMLANDALSDEQRTAVEIAIGARLPTKRRPCRVSVWGYFNHVTGSPDLFRESEPSGGWGEVAAGLDAEAKADFGIRLVDTEASLRFLWLMANGGTNPQIKLDRKQRTNWHRIDHPQEPEPVIFKWKFPRNPHGHNKKPKS